MAESNGNGQDEKEIPATLKPPADGFQRIITIDVNEQGGWHLNFTVHPDAVLLFLQKIQFNMLSGQFKVNKPEPVIIKPTPGEIASAS